MNTFIPVQNMLNGTPFGGSGEAPANEFIPVLDMLDGAFFSARRGVTEEMFELEQSVSALMNKGLTPDEIAPARKVLAAVQAARTILNTLFA